MKKYRIICIALLLSLLLSPLSFALGNDFTFSGEWFTSVLLNTTVEYFREGEYFYYKVKDWNNGYTDSLFCKVFDSGFIGSYDNPSQYIYYDGLSERIDDQLNFISPLNVIVRKGQTFNIQSMMIAPNSYVPDLSKKTVVRFNFSDGSVLMNVPTQILYTYASIGTVSLNSSGVVTGFDSEITGKANIFMTSWTNNTDSDVLLTSITYFISATSSEPIRNFRFGYFADGAKESVVLPGYVEDNLSMISSNLIDINDDFDDALDELSQIKIELASIVEKLNQSGSTTNNYYQTITQATEEQIVKQEQLDELVATARSELEEMKEVIQTVTVPSASDVSSATTSQATQISIDDSLSNATINNVLGKLFENTTLVTMMLSCISIATVGYILYGKRS